MEPCWKWRLWLPTPPGSKTFSAATNSTSECSRTTESPYQRRELFHTCFKTLQDSFNKPIDIFQLTEDSKRNFIRILQESEDVLKFSHVCWDFLTFQDTYNILKFLIQVKTRRCFFKTFWDSKTCLRCWFFFFELCDCLRLVEDFL